MRQTEMDNTVAEVMPSSLAVSQSFSLSRSQVVLIVISDSK